MFFFSGSFHQFFTKLHKRKLNKGFLHSSTMFCCCSEDSASVQHRKNMQLCIWNTAAWFSALHAACCSSAIHSHDPLLPLLLLPEDQRVCVSPEGHMFDPWTSRISCPGASKQQQQLKTPQSQLNETSLETSGPCESAWVHLRFPVWQWSGHYMKWHSHTFTQGVGTIRVCSGRKTFQT